MSLRRMRGARVVAGTSSTSVRARRRSLAGATTAGRVVVAACRRYGSVARLTARFGSDPSEVITCSIRGPAGSLHREPRSPILMQTPVRLAIEQTASLYLGERLP